jgi:rfaE bifunctional protein nucleotidyltransferase chain/domain
MVRAPGRDGSEMSQHKILSSVAALAEVVASHKKSGKTVVQCHGVFDLLHIGHVMHLQAARRMGDVLIVTVTPDRHVVKGPGRPVFNERLRMLALAAIESVDHVVVIDSVTAVEAIATIRPNIYVKGDEYERSEDDITGGIDEEAEAIRAAGGEIRFTSEETFSSSGLINRFLSPYPKTAEAYLERLRSEVTSEEIIDRLETYRHIRPLVIGEAILDEYCYTRPLAKAPREAIIAAQYKSLEVFGGGAVATANHLAAFCNSVTLVASVGDDESQRQVIMDSLRPNVDFVPVVTPDRTTVRKRRFIEPDELTKLFEVQYLDESDLLPETERNAAQIFERLLPKHDLAVVNDFGHGFLTPALRQQLSGSETFLALNTQTNSANLGFNLINKYPRANYCCIDLAESRLASGLAHGTASECASTLIEGMDADWFMTTTGRGGASVIDRDGHRYESPALSLDVVDRVGAGDAFFALTSPWAFKKYPTDLVGLIGNVSGALHIGTVGNREGIDKIHFYKFLAHALK